MRILHFDFDSLEHPWGGGQARRTFEINRRLAAARGWDVTVVTGSYPGARAAEVAVSGGRLGYARIGAGPFPLNVLTFLALQPLAARTRPHDLLVEDFTTPIGPSGSAAWSRAPVVGSAQFLFAGEMSRKYHLPFDLAAEALLARYRHLVALTHAGAEKLRHAAPRAQITVIPQGLRPDDFAPLDAADGAGDYALYLGRLDMHQKGLDVLIRAWSLIPESQRPPLVLAGDGRERSRLEQLVTSLDLGATVRFAGRVEGDVKRALLRGAAFICVPSRYETFCIAAVEALAAARPLLASDLPELREAAGEGAVFVRPDAPHALAAAAAGLWADRERRAQLARRGRDAVAGLTWDSVAERQAAVYEALC